MYERGFDEEEQQFPTDALRTKARLSRGRLFSLVCHNLLKVLKLCTAICLTFMLIFEDFCGELMLPLFILTSFFLYTDVALYAAVPITFKYCSQRNAVRFYKAYKVLKWITRVTFFFLGICFNVFVFSTYNDCGVDHSTPGTLLLISLVAIDVCLLLYCSFVSVVVCGVCLTLLTAAR
jgi:hypothetical protein